MFESRHENKFVTELKEKKKLSWKSLCVRWPVFVEKNLTEIEITKYKKNMPTRKVKNE